MRTSRRGWLYLVVPGTSAEVEEHANSQVPGTTIT